MEILDWQEEFDGMMLNPGSQTDAYLCESDIVIYVGNRGVGKTHLILSKALAHIGKPYYRAAYFRRMVGDADKPGGISDKSKEVFGQFGTHLESQSLRTWKFDSGAKVVFGNYSASEKEFEESVRGIESQQIMIDEITQISENRFNALFSNLRNTKGEKTQIFGTCNADRGGR